ncbi:MAG: hypothetical protein J7452_04130, partial [Thermoflexus sp.]|nr:hypothetical protein [Thermoflexus sp.]
SSCGINRARSRNAVVALKQGFDLRSDGGHFAKQERRGGIETHSTGALAWATRSKQKRRGGIETALLDGPAEESSDEAGTPWWH